MGVDDAKDAEIHRYEGLSIAGYGQGAREEGVIGHGGSLQMKDVEAREVPRIQVAAVERGRSPEEGDARTTALL